MRSLFTFTILFLSTFLIAQAPQVESITPLNQRVGVPINSPITVTFDIAIDPASMTFGNFKVFGRWSGPAEVVFSLTNDNKTVEMSLFEPLMYGEWVTVSLTKGITAADGTPMQRAYTWNFWTEVIPMVGEMEIELIKTIELRQAGEGLLQAYGAYAGDLNNDGYSDLTVVNETSDDLRIFLNDGTGDYSDFEVISMGGDATPSPNEGADFDNDGEIDLAVCTAHDDELRVLFGDGSGTLSDLDNYTTGTNARGLGVTDLDGDGNDDIVIANRGSSNVTLFLNDGFGAFTSSDLNTPGVGESGLAIVDFNNDGIHDLIIGNYGSEEIIVMLGDGAMSFTTSTQVTVSGQPWMLTAGDINNDGWVDILSANSSGDNVAVLLNDTNGGLQTPVYLSEPNALFPLAIDLGDLDGDEDLDIVTSNYTSSTYQIFFNDGTGNFETGPSLAAGTHASCAILHDRDNDGYLDISGTDEGDDLVLLYDLHPGAVSVEEFYQEQIKSIQPNPFTSEMQIEVGEVCPNCQVHIFSQMGVLIQSLTVNGHIITWNSEAVPAGLYLIKLESDLGIEIKKAIKF